MFMWLWLVERNKPCFTYMPDDMRYITSMWLDHNCCYLIKSRERHVAIQQEFMRSILSCEEIPRKIRRKMKQKTNE